MFRVVIISVAVITSLFFACQKGADVGSEANNAPDVVSVSSPKEYTTYTIAAGEQFCDINFHQPIHYNEIKFKVRFDSSCIYRTTEPGNQYDINKLYGFSDNNAHHHDFSARFGWRWSDDSLRLFAYIYNNSIRESKELGTVAIGVEQSCAVKVTAHSYFFSLNGKTQAMPRKSSTTKAEGYKLYPYFGGDELAPHKIAIYIKDL
jgi:hypothetical protein